MAQKVYYSIGDGANRHTSPMSYFAPEKLSKNIPEYVKESSYIRCGAMTSSLKNTYVLKCPVELQTQINILDETIISENLELTQDVLEVKQCHPKSRVFQMVFPYMFFSETPLLIQTMQPFLHINSFFDIGNITIGEFDISKWFRPIVVGFVARAEDIIDINVKRGDVYSYIRFITDKNVELVPFEMNETLHKYKQYCMRYKHHHTNRRKINPLHVGYDAFMKHSMNKRILREIKKQLI